MANILVIDDDRAIVKLLHLALTRAGFHVETAFDGKEGLDKFYQGQFDMVITDIKMPSLDGKAVVKSIRQSRYAATPVVGISGTPWELSGTGFDSVLSKPFSLKSLLGTVQEIACRPGQALAAR